MVIEENNMNSSPILTIRMYVFNEENFMAESISSLLNQTFKSFQLIIINNGSTDSSGEIAETFSSQDSRITVEHVKNNNPQLANQQIKNSTTPYYMFAAGHDIYDPEFIEKCLVPFESDPTVVLSYPQASWFKEGKVISEIPGNFDTRGMEPFSRSMVVSYGLVYAFQAYGIYKTEAIKRVNFPAVIGFDHVYLTELALLGSFAQVNEQLFYMRQTENFDSLEVYRNKHETQGTGKQNITPFVRTLHAYLSIANRLHNTVDKSLLKLAFFTQTLLRNRNILTMYGESINSLFDKPEFSQSMQWIQDFLNVTENEIIQAYLDVDEPVNKLDISDQMRQLVEGHKADYKFGSHPVIDELQIFGHHYAELFFADWQGDIDGIRYENTPLSNKEQFLALDLSLHVGEQSLIILGIFVDDGVIVFPEFLKKCDAGKIKQLSLIISEAYKHNAKQFEFIKLSPKPRIDYSLANDGRALPGFCDYTTAVNHIRRYLFLRDFGISGDILECASGTGYGAAILTQVTEINHYVGLDMDSQAVDIAKGMVSDERFKFTNQPLKENNQKFDFVISLETIEHVANPYVFVLELIDCLKSNGTLIVSIPAEKWAGSHLNPDHFTNWTFSRFKRFFESFFNEVDIRFQQLSLVGPSPLESAAIFQRPHNESLDECFIAVLRSPKQREAETIVVKRTNALGDVLWMTPVLKKIRQTRPDSHIVAVTRFNEALQRNPDVDLVATLDYVPAEQDIIIDLDGVYEQKRELHILEAYALKADALPLKSDPVIFLAEQDLKQAKSFLKQAFADVNLDYLIAIHAAASSPDRIWPVEKWQQAITQLSNFINVGFILVGSHQDFDAKQLGLEGNNRVVSLVHQLALHETASIIAHCDLLVCPDSGLSHVATAVKTSSVVLFGMANPKTRLPFNIPATGIWSKVDCRGCLDDIPAYQVPLCKFGPGQSVCMDIIECSEVVDEVLKILKIPGDCHKTNQTVDALFSPIDSVEKKLVPQKNKLKIAVLSLDHIQHACAFIRIQSIFQSLTEQVISRQIVSNTNGRVSIDRSAIPWADLIIIQRTAPREESQDLIEEIFASGCCVVYESDDLLTEKLPETNYLVKPYQEHIPYIIDVIKRADLVTTSTQFLAEKFSHFNPNVRILPNLIDQKLWLKKLPVIAKKVQTIVFSGTQGHETDLKSIEKCLLTLHEKYQGKIKFIFIGCSTPVLKELPGTEYYDLVPYREYSSFLQNLSVDIAIIPLLEGEFNKSKSNIKWLEYSMCGIAGVYSDVLPYQGIEHGKTGLLAKNNEQDWQNALEWMIENPEQRVEMALAAQQTVIEKYTLMAGADQYLQTWLKLTNIKPHHSNASAIDKKIDQQHDLDALKKLGFATGLDAAVQVLLTISQITGAGVFSTVVSAVSNNSKFLQQYAVTKDELYLHLADTVKTKAAQNKLKHDLELLMQSLQLLSAIDTQSSYFERSLLIKTEVRQFIANLEYQLWTKNHMLLPIDGEILAERMMLKWHIRPSFHLLMLVFPGEEALLANTLVSLGNQYYQEWGLTVVSELPALDPVFEQQEFLNWIQIEGSDNPFDIFNRLIADVESDWVAVVAPGYAFEPHALIQFSNYINIKPEWKLIYTDEDRVETVQASEPVRSQVKFKPDFNLDLLRSSPYVGNFVMVDRISLLAAGGVSSDFGLEGMDTTLRIFDSFGEQSIGHIADVLVHQDKECNRPITDEQLQNTVKRHLQRNNIEADVLPGYLPETCRIVYRYSEEPKVSIIIPTKNKLEYLAPCVESLLEKTQYTNYEVLIVDNQSTDPDVFEFYKELQQKWSDKIKIIKYPHAFNFSSICNFAADQAQGEYLLLLNNDTEVLHKEWLDRMMTHAMREDVGIVGARLVYPETGLIQHAGVVMGLGGIAEHPFIGEFHVKEDGYMGRIQTDQNYSAVTGACLLIDKQIYQSVQGMDEEQFAVSFNDVDLCLKVRDSGYRIVWTPYATLVHHGNVTQKSSAVSEQKVTRFKNEKQALFNKWQTIISVDPSYNQNLSLTKRDFSIEANMPCNWDVNFHDRLRVFGVPLEGGSGDYRLVQPFNGLRKKGLAQCEYLRLQNSSKDRIMISEIARQKPDVVVFHSLITDLNLDLIEECKKLLPEVFLIYMMDDLIDQVPEKSSAHKKIKRSFRDVKPRVRRALSGCDRVIVSTEPLAEFCRDMINDIVVVPNSLENQVWLGMQSKRRQGNKLRVGWAGALQHQGDLEMIAEVVQQTASEVDWVFMGMCPESIKPYIKEFYEAVPILEYPKALAGLNLDLAIAPLEDNRFNEAKSNLRLLEYGILGWPVICSDVYPYRGAPVTCVENSTEAWVSAIRQAIDNPENLAAQGDTLRAWVKSNYMLENNLQLWLDALSPKIFRQENRQNIAGKAAIN